MKLLPYQTYTLTTHMTPAEIQLRLLSGLERSWRDHGRDKTQTYKGIVTADGFRISRIIEGRNSFAAVVSGHYSTHEGHTDIHIRMRMRVLTIIFMSIWLGIVGFMDILLLIQGLKAAFAGKLKDTTPAVLLPFGMFAFVYFMMMYGFKTESNNAKAFLAWLFAPREEAATKAIT